MSIDLLREGLLTLAQAAKLIPRRRLGRPVHSSTLWRWHRKGVKRGRGRIHLEAVRLPSGMATSVEAIARFVARLTGADETAPSSMPMDVDGAVSQLDEDGI